VLQPPPTKPLRVRIEADTSTVVEVEYRLSKSDSTPLI
jgi:hypothetical protein